MENATMAITTTPARHAGKAQTGDGPTGRWVSTGEVARIVGASRNAVVKWCDSGKLSSHRPFGQDSDRRILVVDLLAFIKANGIVNALPLDAGSSPTT